MANNAFIFNGALAGAIGGIQQRWLTSVQPNDYIAVRNAAVRFANAIDTLIPASGSIGASQGSVMQAIAQGVMAERYLVETDNVDALARAVVALYTNIAAQLESTGGGSFVSASQIGWLPAGGSSNVLTLAAANHSPGLYQVNTQLFVLTAGGAGSIQPTINWSMNGARSSVGNAGQNATSLTLLSATPCTTWAVRSDGISPITVQYNPTGATGAPVVDLYLSAQKVS